MSWVTVIWSMIAGACLTLAAAYLLLWFRKRAAWASLLFSVTAIATAILAACELWVMRAQTPEAFGAAIRWGHVPYWVIVVSLVGFVRAYLRAGRPWLAWTVCGLRTLSLGLNFVMTPNLNFREITTLRPVRFFGEFVSVAVGVPNPWMLVGQLSLLLLVIFAADATLTVWRRGDRRSLVMLGGTIVFFVAGSIGQFALTFWGFVHYPVTPSVFFLAIIAVMSYEMSQDVLRAAQLSVDLRESEERLDLAADSAGVGLWNWDFRTNLLWATERARQLYGFSPTEPISFERFLSRVHPDDRDWVVAASRKCAEEGADFRHDYRIALPDGGVRWFKVLARASFSRSGAPEKLAGVSLDITGRKQAEQAIERQRNELAHVTRVSTMSQLASSLAHELNQPLGAILRNAEAGELHLESPSPDLDELRAILADIRKDDLRAGAVIDRIRALMDQRTAERRPVDLGLLAGDTLTLVRADAERRRVRLTLLAEPAIPPVQGDPVQLQQVLLNLLLNALDALGDHPSAERVVTLRVRPARATVEAAVSDTGPGIPANDLPRLFEPFFSTKPTGLGMGLTISRDIVVAHGGRLWAEGAQAGGATFTFSLPATGGDAP
jgi:PAS domain S-box-containing protein